MNNACPRMIMFTLRLAAGLLVMGPTVAVLCPAIQKNL